VRPPPPPTSNLIEVRTKTAIIIPARYASTRFPGKPLHAICGKPLIQHVWEKCCKARHIDRLVVATDDERIANVAAAFGADVVLTSDRHRSGTDRCAEALERMPGVTHIINVQGDEPLIVPNLISKLAKVLTGSPDLDMVTVATPFHSEEEAHNPNAVKVVLDRQRNALYFSRAAIPFISTAARPDRPAKTLLHLGIYGYTTKFLRRFVSWKPGPLEQSERLEQLRALENGAKIRVVLTKSSSIGVDTLDDAAAVERFLSGT
jgi:3-deoxy-manno-octulosonate cytidylyltransferase (CMP-KDO synthetase)